MSPAPANSSRLNQTPFKLLINGVCSQTQWSEGLCRSEWNKKEVPTAFILTRVNTHNLGQHTLTRTCLLSVKFLVTVSCKVYGCCDLNTYCIIDIKEIHKSVTPRLHFVIELNQWALGPVFYSCCFIWSSQCEPTRVRAPGLFSMQLPFLDVLYSETLNNYFI